jgi:sec-independent protein translocase protein TatB
MNGTIFGIGPLEVLVVGILILLVFGPERLPELTRGLGMALRRLRETYVAFTAEFRGELEPIASEFDEVTREIRQEVDAIREAADIRSILKPYSDDINKAVKLEPVTALPAPKVEPAVAAGAGATTPTNTIAPPKATANGAAAKGAATKGAAAKGAATGPAKAIGSPPALPRLIALPEDNPWASIGAPVRSDRLDDDSPWRL